MLIEGVNFIVEAIKPMKKKAFIEAHKNVLWQDRNEKEREKMLSDAYDTIVKD